MGIILRQDENRSELQKRVAAQLTEKAKKKSDHTGDMPDGITDSAYIKDTKQTTSYGWIWMVLLVVAIVAAVWYFIASNL